MSESKLPKAGIGDIAHALVTVGGRALLGLGVPPDTADALVKSVSVFLPTPLEKRYEEFWAELEADVERLKEKVDGLPFAETEQFAAFVNAAVRRVGETSEREKLKHFRHAILNAAQGRVEQLDLFRNLLDALTVDHARFLTFFSEARSDRKLRPSYLAEDAAEAIVTEWRDLVERREYVEVLFRDLWSRCLLAFPQSVPGVLPPGLEKLYVLDGPRLSSLGEGFLEMIGDPLI